MEIGQGHDPKEHLTLKKAWTKTEEPEGGERRKLSSENAATEAEREHFLWFQMQQRPNEGITDGPEIQQCGDQWEPQQAVSMLQWGQMSDHSRLKKE